MYQYGEDGEIIVRDKYDAMKVGLVKLDFTFGNEEDATKFLSGYIVSAGLCPIEGEEEVDEIIIGGQPEMGFGEEGAYVVSLLHIPECDVDQVYNNVSRMSERGILPLPDDIIQTSEGITYGDLIPSNPMLEGGEEDFGPVHYCPILQPGD